MGLPNILIEFKTKSTTAIKRGSRGVVGIIIIDTPIGVSKIDSALNIPEGLNALNKEYIERAFLGGVNSINHVILVVSDTVANGLKTIETQAFDYLVLPHDATSGDVSSAVTFIKSLRDLKGIKVKAVLPNSKADHEGIINFTTTDIKVGENVYTSSEYCSRIGGLLAGTPLQLASTFFVLNEVSDVPKFTREELDKKIDAGEFLIYHDGEKVKVARGINSLTTYNALKSEDYKYIKIVDTMDLIYTDIKRTCEDSYIGKFPNNYDNKINLVVAISSYLEGLRDEGILDSNVFVGIDLDAQTAYLKAKGYDTDNMSELEIKEANTDTNVFIMAKFKILNAIEDITVKFYI